MRDSQNELFEEDALMGSNELGAWGERKAANYLRLRGYKIVDRNCSYRQGEIDIIAQKGGYIVFVEVKLRKDCEHGEAKEFVTAAKQQRILAAAQMWLKSNDKGLQPRFDVIEIYAPNGMTSRGLIINHIENSF